MIKLIKSTFFNEADTKQKLTEFVQTADILSMSEECRKFEQSFASKQGRRFALMVNSGSSANLILIQALLNLGRLKPGDKIGFSALTWATNIMPIIQLGLTPVAIDCEVDTLNTSPEILQPHLAGLRALFLTNVLGFADEVGTIRDLCDEAGVILLEDNCESLGSMANGRLLGNFGLASTFSFFVGHHLSTIEGGMVCTDDPELRQMLSMARAHGWDRNLPAADQQRLQAEHHTDPFFAKYTFYDLAYNVRPTEINGLLGNIQLPYWSDIVNQRAQNFRIFQAAIAANDDFLPLNVSHMNVVSNFSMPVICRDQATFERYRQRFMDADVEIRPIIAGDMTQQPFYRKHVPGQEACRNAAFIHQNGFYFGNNPELTAEELNILTELLKPLPAPTPVYAQDLPQSYTQQETTPMQPANNRKVALITGITGQDGSYLSELLLEKGYSVHGLVRRSSSFNRGRIEHLFQDPHERKFDINLHYGDLADASSLQKLIRDIKPSEVYNLGAQSHVQVSFETPEYTGDTTGLGTARLLEAIHQEDTSTRFYQASSSEMFGLVQEVPQRESTPFYPRSPYGAAKVYSYWMTVNYRESYNIFASNGILFNHESPRRGESFVTRKITYGLARIIAGEMEKLYMGNLESKRDWGYAKDYVEGMWRMLQQDKPGDYVLATGETHTVREFIEVAFAAAGIEIEWRGQGVDEKGINSRTGKVVIEIDPRYFRPAEVDLLIGDASKARRELGWTPATSFKELAKLMVEHDMSRLGLNTPTPVRSYSAFAR